jgi:chondroitin 4-sulfotransferase 11
MIIPESRLIFVHIQKTGGTAIAMALGQNPDCAEKHFLARDLRKLYGFEIWNTCFKFAFVRNPWDRLVSWWSMIDSRREVFANGDPLNRFQQFVLERAKTFEEFLVNCDEEIADSDGSKWIYRNQLDYLVDESGRQLVDFIGRFESLQWDLNVIGRRTFGRPIPLAHVNKSAHRHYSEYFTPVLAKKVASRFERDIDAFGYAFGN